MREAIAAQVLEEVDGLVVRLETLHSGVSSYEQQLKATTDALVTAADQYRLAVTAFTEQAKAELSEHLQRASAISREEQISAMQEAARIAFRSESSDKAANLALVLSRATQDFAKAGKSRLVESAAIAACSSVFTAALVFAALKL